jgi:putative flippase GtrA
MRISPALIRFIQYSAVGLGTFLIDLWILYVLITFFELNYILAAGAAFLIAVSVNYVCSRRYVFTGTPRGVLYGYINFMLIASIGVLFVMGGMYVLVGQFSLNYLLARCVLGGLTGVCNYILNLYVNFKVAGIH